MTREQLGEALSMAALAAVARDETSVKALADICEEHGFEDIAMSLRERMPPYGTAVFDVKVPPMKVDFRRWDLGSHRMVFTTARRTERIIRVTTNLRKTLDEIVWRAARNANGSADHKGMTARTLGRGSLGKRVEE